MKYYYINTEKDIMVQYKNKEELFYNLDMQFIEIKFSNYYFVIPLKNPYEFSMKFNYLGE